MMVAAAPAAKWAWPAIAFAGAGLLAIDGTQVSVAIVAAAQATIIAYLGYRQFRDKARQDQRQQSLQRETSRNTLKIDGQDKLIDQLQEQGANDRGLITTLQQEIARLNDRVLELQRRTLASEIGASRLIGQLQQLDIEPVWLPDTTRKGVDQ